MIDSFTNFLNNFIIIKPVTIGELLTFLSSLILLIITWRSVTNAKQANEITKKALNLQSEQFELSIKPDLTFDIPPIKYTEYENNKKLINVLIKPDHIYYIKNLSKNIAYDVSITTYIYLPNSEWDKYYLFLKQEFDKDKARPNLVTHNTIYSLDDTGSLKATIPHYYLKFNIISYDGTIDNPILYIRLTYKVKTGKIYEDYFELRETGHVLGRFDKPDDLELHFHPRTITKEKLKNNLFMQKEKLETDLPEKGKLYYYNL